MEAAEPLVQRHPFVAVVAVEVAVVQVVEVAAVVQRMFVAQFELVEPGVARRRADAGVHQMKDGVQRMRRDDPVDHHPGQVQQVLDGVHRQARPRPDVDVLVMQIVGVLVQRLPVGETMRPVEVRLPQQQDEHHHQHAVHRVPGPTHVGDELVGVQPQRDRLVAGPDRAAAGEVPEHVVAGLVAEQKRAAVAGEPARVVLVALVLGALDVQPQVQTAGDDQQQRRIAQIQLGDPADRERLGTRQAGREEQPCHDGDARVDGVLGIQQPVMPEQELQDRSQLKRPGEQRRRLGQRFRLPLAAYGAACKIGFGHIESTLPRASSVVHALL